MYKRHGMVRYFFRTHTPSIGFFPFGLIGLLLILLPLLYGILFFAKNTIEKAVYAEVKKELSTQSFNWVDVDVDGQNVHLSGVGPVHEGDKAIALTKAILGATWAGHLTPAIDVTAEFDGPLKVSPPKTIPVWGDVVAVLNDDGHLSLRGVVANEAQKTTLLASVNSALSTTKIIRVSDHLTVSTVELLPDSASLAKRAVGSIIHCNSGRSSAVKGVFTLMCNAPYHLKDNITEVARAPLKGGALGQVIVNVSEACNKAFAALLQSKAIGFASGSHVLKSSSRFLLDKIAALSQKCPGTIYVEGHTDDTGNFDANIVLSNARARAVVEALIERSVQKKRLIAKGYGSKKPKALGSSQEARALNRRIEFRVLGFGEK